MVDPVDHLDKEPDKDLSKREAKEQALHGVVESYSDVDPSDVEFDDESAPSHSNADGQIKPDIPDRAPNPGVEYFGK